MSEPSTATLEPASTMTTEEVVALTKKLNYGTWRYQKSWNPLHVVDAEGCYFTDAAGKRYLDFSSQLMCVNLGHKNQAVIQAIQEQAASLPYIMPGYATTTRAELSKLLLEVLPAGLEKFFFTTSGTEANEAAFKIARMYTGKTKIIARYRSYHGSTMASIAATGDPRRWPLEPGGKGQGFLFAPEVNCYKCPIKHTYPSCGIACADYLEHMIENESDVAAVIVEPVVGTNGVLIPPPEYFPRLREICDRHDVLLIADEVMSGWGRTGEWFAVDHWGTKPDMLVTAKGITSAYVPLGVCATTARIGAYFEDHFFAHGHTYEAHPMTLAPAVASIHEMRRLDLVARSREMGAYLGEKLHALKAKHPSIGEVRGLGLFWAVELVKNQATKAPLNTMQDKVDGKVAVVEKVAAEMMKRGVTIQAWISHFVIAPPLIIEKSEIDSPLMRWMTRYRQFFGANRSIEAIPGLAYSGAHGLTLIMNCSDMTLTLQLSDEQTTALQAKAAAEGLSLEAWIVKLAGPTASNPPVERPLHTAAQIILDSMKDVPPEIMATMPTDGASQHDHYIYGWPKREV